jgi:diguanylate cyclase (GGDEF)-like protein
VRDSHEDAVVEYRIRHNDGSWRWFESSIAPMFAPDGSVVEYVGNARDITERKSQASEMQLMAMTDELTGIGNRRVFIRAMSKELKRARRYKYELSMLMVDVDNLKTINDSFGHGSGDGALQTVARVCAEVCRDADEACRIGGDEFAILLPHSTEAAAFDIGERIRAALARQPVVPGMPDGSAVSVSVGVGTVIPEDTDYSELVERADRALHSAKERGRNHTCVLSGK